MKRRRPSALPRALERALHGGRAIRGASDPLRPPEEWELVAAAIELAFLAEEPDRPPAHLGPELERLLDPARKTPR